MPHRLYFIFRGLIGDIDDFRWFLRAFTILLIPYVALLLVEMRTGQNPFNALSRGCVVTVDELKGKAAGAASALSGIPSLLGTLGASFLPLYIGLAIGKIDRMWGRIGMVLCPRSFFWPTRADQSPRDCRRAGRLVSLADADKNAHHSARHAGLVYLGRLRDESVAACILPARLSEHLGVAGDSWHRSHLMEMAAGDFGKWWFWGMPFAQTAGWFPYNLAPALGGSDITNEFIIFGLTAGLLAIIVFRLLLVKCYKTWVGP